MKKIITIALSLFLIIAFISCSSTAPVTDSGADRVAPASFPEPIRQAILNAPEDVLVGVGIARLASLSQSRTISMNRARAEISRQMNSMVEDMIRDYQASSEVDPAAALSFQENITVTLSRADVSGARMVDMYIAQDETVWTVVYMDRATVAREITQAQAAARLAVPALASFDAEARMQDAFARYNSETPQARSFD